MVDGVGGGGGGGGDAGGDAGGGGGGDRGSPTHPQTKEAHPGNLAQVLLRVVSKLEFIEVRSSKFFGYQSDFMRYLRSDILEVNWNSHTAGLQLFNATVTSFIHQKLAWHGADGGHIWVKVGGGGDGGGGVGSLEVGGG